MTVSVGMDIVLFDYTFGQVKLEIAYLIGI